MTRIQDKATKRAGSGQSCVSLVQHVAPQIPLGPQQGTSPDHMLRRLARGLPSARRTLATMSSSTESSSHPMEDTIRERITSSLQPSRFDIFNDSHLHAHHAAMAGSSSSETHFRLVITSEAFRSKMQPARHRMIYALLKDEMARDGGIHALQLRTMTPEEEERRRAGEGASRAA